MQALNATLERFRQHGPKLNRAKCSFAETALEALGHKIDAAGVHKADVHIQAVRDAPKPSTPEELQLFLGKATYYSAFINNLSTRDRPIGRKTRHRSKDATSVERRDIGRETRHRW